MQGCRAGEQTHLILAKIEPLGDQLAIVRHAQEVRAGPVIPVFDGGGQAKEDFGFALLHLL